jgi:hypothetical protein
MDRFGLVRFVDARNIADMAYDHIVYIVDDDRRIRESLLDLLESFGMNELDFQHRIAQGAGRRGS